MIKTCLHFSTLILISLILFQCKPSDRGPEITSEQVVPTKAQISYQQMELIGFIHYSINTFTDKEWGYGDESPELFNPSQNDVEQWVITAKEVGMKQLILTAKHHDGFCLWPSIYTEHSIKNSPYKEGRGDIVREFTDACQKHGLKAGLYLSPWDRNHKDYGSEKYINYYRNQLTEILSNYGIISEIWFDGANGGDGYYGGANEKRQIDRKSYYDWDSTFKLVKKLQPDIFIFSDAGPDVHWIGNERGFAGETFWSTFDTKNVMIGQSNVEYLNIGDPEGNDWVVGQCDVSIRPGWFYHSSQDSLVKSPQELLDIYYKSVGRNAILLLNLPPDRRGLIHENDIQALREFRLILDNTFEKDISKKAVKNLEKGSKGYWSSPKEDLPAYIDVEWKEEQAFNRILIQEDIQFGQRIKSFEIEILSEGKWESVFKGTTIGYKRLIRLPSQKSKGLRIMIKEALYGPVIKEVGVFNATM